jgi:manganese efflux pump family protein
MDFSAIVLIAIGLAMDSVAVSVSCGLILHKFKRGNALRIGLFMGLFQAMMPLIGWLGGIAFKDVVEAWDHWIALIILSFLGGKMIIGELTKKDDYKCFDPTNYKTLTGLGLATSIDALAVGITFAMIDIHIAPAMAIIGFVSFFLSYLAVYLGCKFRNVIKFPFEIVGGAILILIGVKIFVEHMWM